MIATVWKWGIHLGPLEYLDWEGEQGQDDWSEHLQNRGVVPVSSQFAEQHLTTVVLEVNVAFVPLITNHHFFVAPL